YPGDAREAVQRPGDELALAALDVLDAYFLLDLEGQRGPELLDDRRRAGVLAHLHVFDEPPVEAADVRDGAAAGDRGTVQPVERLVEQQQAGRAGPAQELVRAQHDGVEVVVGARGRRADVDAHVRR